MVALYPNIMSSILGMCCTGKDFYKRYLRRNKVTYLFLSKRGEMYR